ncbi:MAG: hypothetical protein R3D89_08580 [Sphingomonadaceae bacterium]
MRRTIVAALPLAIAACAMQGEAPLESVEAIEERAAPPLTLEGSWELLLLDDAEVAPDHTALGKGLRLEADERKLWFPPLCAGKTRDYAIDGGVIALSDPRREGEVTVACAIGMPPRTEQFLAALEQANTVESAPAGTIRLHGGGHVLLLVPREGVGE